MSFWLDDVSKTITFADDTALIVTRFDDNWISASTVVFHTNSIAETAA